MEKLDLDELRDPVKLASELGNAIIALGNGLREVSGMPTSVLRTYERCVFLAGIASGTLVGHKLVGIKDEEPEHD